MWCSSLTAKRQIPLGQGKEGGDCKQAKIRWLVREEDQMSNWLQLEIHLWMFLPLLSLIPQNDSIYYIRITSELFSFHFYFSVSLSLSLLIYLEKMLGIWTGSLHNILKTATLVSKYQWERPGRMAMIHCLSGAHQPWVNISSVFLFLLFPSQEVKLILARQAARAAFQHPKSICLRLGTRGHHFLASKQQACTALPKLWMLLILVVC